MPKSGKTKYFAINGVPKYNNILIQYYSIYKGYIHFNSASFH